MTISFINMPRDVGQKADLIAAGGGELEACYHTVRTDLSEVNTALRAVTGIHDFIMKEAVSNCETLAGAYGDSDAEKIEQVGRQQGDAAEQLTVTQLRLELELVPLRHSVNSLVRAIDQHQRGIESATSLSRIDRAVAQVNFVAARRLVREVRETQAACTLALSHGNAIGSSRRMYHTELEHGEHGQQLG